MVEFSLFYFLPPPPLFLYEVPAETTYVSGGFNFAQIDNLQTFVKPEGLPDNYAFPVAFKVSNGMRFHTSLMWSGDWSFYIALPSVYVSTPPLGTSALQGNPPEVIWGEIDATIEDTLLPVEVDDLRGKVPVTWRIKGNVTIQPILTSESGFSYLPITFGIGKNFGDYFLNVEGNVSRFSGKGGWDIRYVGGQIYEDTFALSGVQNEAVFGFQLAEENVARYVYSFEMDPTILYNAGFQFGRRFGRFRLGGGVETFRTLTLNFSDSLYYNYISDLVGNWVRSELFNNDLYAEYSADSDTVYLRGSATVGLKTEGSLRDSVSTTGTHAFPVRGGTYPFLTLSYTGENVYATAKVSGEGLALFWRAGGEYGGFGGLDLRFQGERLSCWQLGAFYASESFIFSFQISRAFGHISYPYVDFKIPLITKELYAYSFGLSFVWKITQ